MDENTVRRIIQAREIIRNKLEALRAGKAEQGAFFEQVFQPLTDPLNKLPPLLEKKDVVKNDEASHLNLPIATVFHRYYNSNSYDDKYGPIYDSFEREWKIGNASFKMDKNHVFIDDKQYSATPGLQELLFSKHPNRTVYNEEDVTNYVDILEESDAINKLRSKPGRKNFKYKFIKSLLNLKTGTGLMSYSENNLDYVYYDDPNELVERLKLLIASQSAGHTNHDNEIISILEELKEARIIL